MAHYHKEKPSIDELRQELEVSLKAWDLLVGERDHFYDQYVAGQQEIVRLQSTLQQNRTEMQEFKKDLEDNIKLYAGAREDVQRLRQENDTLQEGLKKYITETEDQTMANKPRNTSGGNVSRKMYVYCRDHYLLSRGIPAVVGLALGVYIGSSFTNDHSHSKSPGRSASALSDPEKLGKQEAALPYSLPLDLDPYYSPDAGLDDFVARQIIEFEELNAFAKAHHFLPSARTRVTGQPRRIQRSSSPASSISRDEGLPAAPASGNPSTSAAPLPASSNGIITESEIWPISRDAGLSAAPESGNPPASAAPLPPSPPIIRSEITPSNPTP